MKRFIFLQLWLGVLVLIIFIYYRETQDKIPASALRLAEKEKEVRDILLADSLRFAEEVFPLGRIDFQRQLEQVLQEDFLRVPRRLMAGREALMWLSPIQEVLTLEHLPTDLAYWAVAACMDDLHAPFAATGGFWGISKDLARQEELRMDDYWDERYHPVKSTHMMALHLKRQKKDGQSWVDVLIRHAWDDDGTLDSIMHAQRVRKFYDIYADTPAQRQKIAACFALLLRAITLKQLARGLQKVSITTPNKHRRRAKRVSTKDFSVEFASLRVDTLSPPHALPAYVAHKGYKNLRSYNPWWRTPHARLGEGAHATSADTLLFCLPFGGTP